MIKTSSFKSSAQSDNNASNVRSSNFELLRIVAMILIVFSHYAVIGVMHTSFGEPYQIWTQANIINRILICFMSCGGDTGVGAFFIISGYFLCKKTKQRKIASIICTVIFYSIAGIFLNVLFSLLSSNHSFSLNVILDYVKLCLNPVTGNNYWFATSYIVLIILSPIINQITISMSSSKMRLLIVVSWFLWYVLGYVLQVSLWGIERAIWFYLIGTYIGFHYQGKRNSIIGFILLFSISCITYAMVTYFIASSIGFNQMNGLLASEAFQNILKAFRSTLISPVCAVALFMMFFKFKVKNSKTINAVAATTFGIYLIHECPINRELLWEHILKVDTIHYHSHLMPLYCVLTVAGIFIAGMCVDFFRKKFVEPIMLDGWNRSINYFTEQ